MPDIFKCTACEYAISVGSYHGGSPYEWFVDLYCRECGAGYVMGESTSQFLASFQQQEHHGKPRSARYELKGETKSQTLIWIENQPPPEISCENCNAKGPFGEDGPISGSPPEGLESKEGFPHWRINSETRGKCPKCKSIAMKYDRSWIT